MVFPGVLRGRPGPRLATTHTSRPRRSLSSPWMSCWFSVAGLKQVDAVPGRFEEPHAGRPGGVPTVGGAALHLSGLALCGSGSASSSNVRPSQDFVKRGFHVFSARSEKTVWALAWTATLDPQSSRPRGPDEVLLGAAYPSCDNGVYGQRATSCERKPVRRHERLVGDPVAWLARRA